MVAVLILAVAVIVIPLSIWRVISLEGIFTVALLVFVFLMGRAKSCASSIGFAMYIEGRDFSSACELLKSSDCIKNADQLVTTLANLAEKAGLEALKR